MLQLFSLLALCCTMGCQTPKGGSQESAEMRGSGRGRFDWATRNNALALLDDLLDDEKKLKLILIIKGGSPDFKRLVKDISETAGDGAKMLEARAKEMPELQIKEKELPPGEDATRKAISQTKQYELLHSKGTEFEFRLLLTQVESMNYGAHLALVAAENEPQPEYVRALLRLSAELRQLHERVVSMLKDIHPTP